LDFEMIDKIEMPLKDLTMLYIIIWTSKYSLFPT